MLLTNVLLSAYCICQTCCGKTDGITASGRRAVVGVTIAAPANFAFGTEVILTLPSGKRLRRVVTDRLSRRFPNRWDLLVSSHKEATRFGLKRVTITICPPTPQQSHRTSRK